MSFANVRMYNAVLPSFSSKKDNEDSKEGNTIINGDDPKNRDAVNNAIFDVNEDE